MTYAELAAIEARAEAATPGPWRDDGGGCIVQLTDAGCGYPLDRYPDSKDIVMGETYDDSSRNGVVLDSDCAFIAAARTDVPALVAEVRALRSGLDFAERELRDLASRAEAAEAERDRLRDVALSVRGYLGHNHQDWRRFPEVCGLRDGMMYMVEQVLAGHEPPPGPLDIGLLAKFASGEGGRRTGMLMRAGLIRVEVTEAGRAALAEKEP